MDTNIAEAMVRCPHLTREVTENTDIWKSMFCAGAVDITCMLYMMDVRTHDLYMSHCLMTAQCLLLDKRAIDSVQLDILPRGMLAWKSP